MNTTAGKWAVGLGGAATGAALGAAIGSAVPVIGTAIGAIVGGAFGGLAPILSSVDRAERNQTGGLTFDEYEKFAALAAEKGYGVADGTLDREAAKELLEEGGFEVESMDKFMNRLDRMGAEFDELANKAMALKEAERARL
jgi:hypothetical protein